MSLPVSQVWKIAAIHSNTSILTGIRVCIKECRERKYGDRHVWLRNVSHSCLTWISACGSASPMASHTPFSADLNSLPKVGHTGFFFFFLLRIWNIWNMGTGNLSVGGNHVNGWAIVNITYPIQGKQGKLLSKSRFQQTLASLSLKSWSRRIARLRVSWPTRRDPASKMNEKKYQISAIRKTATKISKLMSGGWRKSKPLCQKPGVPCWTPVLVYFLLRW